MQRSGLVPEDVVLLTFTERDDLADRLFQVRCAAEDVHTALSEGARKADLLPLVEDLLRAAKDAERIR